MIDFKVNPTGVNVGADPGNIRLIMRVFFRLTVAFAMFLGNQCCHSRNVLKILNGSSLALPNFTGWLQGLNLLKTLVKLRRLPGGVLGLLMLLSWFISLGADIAVSGFVRGDNVIGRCNTTQSLHLPPTLEAIANASTGFNNPASVGLALNWALSSQITSSLNGGKVGIFKDADNSTTFYADESDLLGFWNCTENGTEMSFSKDQDIADAKNSFIHNSYLYDTWNNQIFNLAGDYTGSFGNATHYIWISTSPLNPSDKSYDAYGFLQFKSVIDVKDDRSTEMKHLRAFNCSCQAQTGQDQDVLHSIQKSINVTQFIIDWTDIFQGNLYEDMASLQSVQSTGPALERLLNAVTMLTGTGNLFTYTPQTHSCLLTYTLIPWGVVALLIATACLAIFLTICILYLKSALVFGRKRFDRLSASSNSDNLVSAKALQDQIPNGITGWMQQAAHETNMDLPFPTSKSLSKWTYQILHDNHGRRIRKATEEDVRASVNVIRPGRDASLTPRLNLPNATRDDYELDEQRQGLVQPTPPLQNSLTGLNPSHTYPQRSRSVSPQRVPADFV